MSVPSTAIAPLNVVTNPILMSFCAFAPQTATASRADPSSNCLSILRSLGLRPARALVGLIDSVPEFSTGDIGTFPHRLEFLPNHGVMHLGAVERLRAEPAIGAGHHVFPADQICEANDALGD